MLTSILKVLFFFALVIAITLGAIQYAENGSALIFAYGGQEYALSPLKTLAFAGIALVLAWVVLKLLGLLLAVFRFLAGDETAIDRYFARSRERKGYRALGDAVLAIASGEGKLAQDSAAKAGKYLDQPYLTNLLSAQAAEISGDTARAEKIYRQLLEDDRTRFVGIRGLMRQRLDEGDTATALLLAQKAYALKPRHKEIQDTLLELEMREHDWKGARQMLKEKRRQGEIPQDVHIRRDALLALQEAKEVLAEGSSISAREAAISVAKASPDLIPAAVLAARSYIAQKDFRNASRVLEKAWSVRPHPDLAATYAEIAPDEKPAARMKRFERLIATNPDNEESRLLKAELLLTVEDFPGARRALGDLAVVHPTVRTLSIMAAVERGEGADDSVVRGWLARALTASRGPQWVCDKCHNIMADWSPVCDNCGGFDTLTWREPEDGRTGYVPSAGAEMLPLLVGGPKPTISEAEVAEDVDLPEETTPVAEKVEIANVAPGMVPRESDYTTLEPVSTVTTADARREPAAAEKVELVEAEVSAEPEPAPQVVTPEPAPEPKPEVKPAPIEDEERVMVRPDVVPPDEADWTEGKIKP